MVLISAGEGFLTQPWFWDGKPWGYWGDYNVPAEGRLLNLPLGRKYLGDYFFLIGK